MVGINEKMKRKLYGQVEFKLHAESKDSSGYSMWQDICKRLDQIYAKYDVLERLENFKSSHFVNVEEETKKDLYSFPEVTIWLRCKKRKSGINLYRNKIIYEYGDGVYSEKFHKRYTDKLSKIEKNYDIEIEHDNYIPPHNNGWLIDHYGRRGPEVCTYLLCKIKN